MRLVAGVLLVLVIAAWVVWQGLQPQQGMQAMPAWRAPQLSTVAAIDISGPGMARVHLARKGDGWQLNGKVAADARAVRHLLDDLQQMRPIRMVTGGHAHDAELELGSKAVQLTLADASGKVVDRFEIGKQGTDLISTYVRHQGEDAVMAMNRALLWQVKRLPDAWQAKQAAPHPKPRAAKAS